METNRLKLQSKLEEILGSRNVYFQPPSSIKMKYPAIVYDRKKFDNRYANNSVYNRTMCYEIIVIDDDPDNEAISKLLDFPMCTFDRHYESDSLNHDVFTLYY